MSAPVQVALALLGLVVAARTRLNAVGSAGPVRALARFAAVLVLALAAVVLLLARLLLRDGPRLRPGVVVRT